MKEKQLRTCLGCGRKDKQGLLLCFAKDQAGKVVQDSTRRLSGRHVYCCPTASCWTRMMKNRKRVARAFRAETVEFGEELSNLFGSVE